MPGTAVLCLLVMTGDDLGSTFLLLVIFLALLWVIGTPGRVFAGLLILMALAMMLMIVSAKYRLGRLVGFLDQQASSPTGAGWQGTQGKYALGSGGITAWIVVQALVNIGAVIGVLPITGVPLPLVSAGLSSLLVTLVALGMLMSFARLEPGAQEALAARGPGWPLRVLSWLGLAKRRR